MLEGLVKHNGPVVTLDRPVASLPAAFRAFSHIEDLELASYAGPEAQVAALADDIAYNNHDIDDGLSAGLFTIEEISEVALVGRVFAEVRTEYPLIDRDRLIAESIRRLIGIWVTDLTTETRRRAKDANPQSAEDVRAMDAPIVGFSDRLLGEQRDLRLFLMERMYRHYKVNRKRSQARRILRDLFHLFLAEPDTLPPPWRVTATQSSRDGRARTICDYLAGMTDNYAIDEHRRLFNLESMI